MSLNFTERKSAFNNQRFPVNRLIHYIQWSASKPFVNWIMQIPLPTLTAQPFIRCTLSEGLFKYRKQVHTTYWMSWTHNEDKCSDTDTWIRDVIRTSAEMRGKPLFPPRKGLYFICLLSFSWFALTNDEFSAPYSFTSLSQIPLKVSLPFMQHEKHLCLRRSWKIHAVLGTAFL